uniref:BEN domain-containing protein n=1 Tax=Latimeria chalumnae TaxID=7897 RepID=H3A652_LATCH
MRTRETEYESNGDVVYEYETDYECRRANQASEASYNGEQQRTLTEILNYCQVMYEAIQKLDKKFDSLQRKVMEVQHVQMKPVFLKPVSIRRNLKFQINSSLNTYRSSPNSESQQPQFNTPGRQSPPLPTIVSTHSLRPPSVQYSVPSRAPDIAQMATILDTSLKSSAVSTGSPLSPPPKRILLSFSKECIGDPKRNVKVPGNFLMKARQKTKAKYAARYLIRVLFTKETLLCSSVLGDSTRDLKPLDPNKIAAMREFLAVTFPTYDLSEDGRDWKTCVTNLNAMLRSMRNETRKVAVSNPNSIPSSKNMMMVIFESYTGACTANLCTLLTVREDLSLADLEENQAPVAEIESNTDLNWRLDVEFLGKRWRNILLPFSVLYVAKRKSRPELAARYLIRHLFPEDVLVKSNVYGNPERGVAPLDFNKINALR